ncbi:MAG: signal recognition particle-docking protein FtsY [Anaerolineales bacterium]|jgi:fused signal recognition particle receptor
MSTVMSKWKIGLEKTSKSKFGQIATFFGATEITSETWDDLEALLIQADLGVVTSQYVITNLSERVKQEGITKSSVLLLALRDELRKLLINPPQIEFLDHPSVILIVGVNGSGKTTTIAKLSYQFNNNGKKVLLGAADTFRAAAVDQLQIWAERLGVGIVSGQPGGDAGAVAFDTVTSGISRDVDLIIIDTAGRLHTRYNLMEELKKVYRVVGKAQPGSPHAVWLVMDSTTGQNALQQAHAFTKAVNVTGVILAKLDSSARGGMAFAIQRELNIPILFAGLGEDLQDLQSFNPDAFIDGILSGWDL